MGLRIWAILFLLVFTGTPLFADELVKIKLGGTVNTDARELSPVVSPDGEYLYFVREFEGDLDPEQQASIAAMSAKAAEGCKMILAQPDKFPPAMVADCTRTASQAAPQTAAPAGGTGRFTQRNYVSRRQSDGSWGKAEKLPSPLNNPMFNTYVFAALPDNNTLFYATEVSGGASCFRGANADGSSASAMLLEAMNGGKMPPCEAFHTVTRSGKTWVADRALQVEDLYTLSDRMGGVVSPDGQTLVTALRRPEGMGGYDLYLSVLQDDGRWSVPVSLGDTLNTAADETGPSLAPDGRTLYFASDRPGGSGDFDIYMTRRQGDGWMDWSAPENMGEAINTPEGDTHLAVDATGAYAFMSIGERGKEDIWQFVLPANLRPLPVAFVRGRVTDPAAKPLAASILYQRLSDRRSAGRANSDVATGRYQIALPVGEDYAFRASAPRYIAVSEHIDLREAKQGDVFERDLVLVPIKVGERIRLNNVFFDFNKSDLLPESREELDRLVGILNDYPRMTIEIGGHTDNIGQPKDNLALSTARAQAVMDYLAGAGIDGARLTSRGYGEGRPVATNDTDEGRQLNRRVEFTIVKM